ncbi:TfdA family Taurine catabolism dioxygenase TauD [Penicillium atrosanguineum]|uniref:TfdA family Taurine catabolism dioxygenase TauD n=1 Tax=Penicillium atrosanguineum TaxID=1132637 RepID=A0A9W9KYI4_9EURO|nr:uncharacterized protein N7443_001131 [Penicillium atrosanguineum]KAJ5127069.1 TfdA family Taurine catabolism dioxygenase TauD [Penicillium atrosanguineum]KAJ5314247.1 hypothetical protein N7443_001131 [Penicillium atrosanguineum]KAJ5331413.1 TfdA family Taurine catabolism dioxygenase TauD [Penicillium atrosanguineum]
MPDAISQDSRSTGLPSITEAQTEALDALHFLAERYICSPEFPFGDYLLVVIDAIYYIFYYKARRMLRRHLVHSHFVGIQSTEILLRANRGFLWSWHKK